MILRIHDQNQLLPQVEAFQGSAVSASILTPNPGSFPLLLLYANSRVRDYGAILPVGEPLSVLVSSGRLILTDQNGSALTAQGLPFQISLSDFQLPNAILELKFRPPDVKMLHVFITGTQ